MAIDIKTLVVSRLGPVPTIWPTFLTTIDTEIAAQLALQGVATQTELTDKERVYVAALTLEGLVVPLTLLLPEEVQEVSVQTGRGTETVKLPARDRFLELLQKAIATMKTTAAKVAAPDDVTEKPPRWPGCGVVGIS